MTRSSHGTFYLYFESKDDLFSTLLRDVLQDMTTLADDFPVFTSNQVGENAPCGHGWRDSAARMLPTPPSSGS
ncbi:MAG: TetR/AcrR family transcriptional regulator [Streptosporangiaceae bacterium]